MAPGAFAFAGRARARTFVRVFVFVCARVPALGLPSKNPALRNARALGFRH